MRREIGAVLPDADGGAQDCLVPVDSVPFDESISRFADQFALRLAAPASDRGKVVSLPAGQIDLGRIT